MKVPLLAINPTKILKRSKHLLSVAVILICIFLMGGGIDFVTTAVNGVDRAYIITYPKLTALSPVAMSMYGLGFLGLLFFLWGAKDYRSNPDNPKVEKQTVARCVTGIFLIGMAYFVIEVILRVGYASL